MAFRVGQKVRCIDASEALGIPGFCMDMPIKGQVYTVSAVGLVHPADPNRLPCILVEEIDRTPDDPHWQHRFRPLIERKTDISVFTQMLHGNKSPVKV